MANPMNQFEVKTIGPKIEIGNFDISFSNASLFMVITVTTISLLFIFATQKKSLVPSRLQLLAEMAYEFVAKMISETAGSKARPYFPFILTLFLFGCGYKVVNYSELNNFDIASIETNGNERINYKIKNKLLFNSSKNDKRLIKINLETTKEKKVKEKN